MKYFIFTVIIFNVILCINPAKSAKILYISLLPSPSHHIWHKTLVKGLRDKGHEITFVTQSTIKDDTNFTVFTFEGIYEKLNHRNIESYTEHSNLQSIKEFFDFLTKLMEWDMESEGYKNFMAFVDTKPKFDLILMDVTAGYHMYPIIEKLGFPPAIATSPFGIQPYSTLQFGFDLQPSYFPIYFLEATDEMSFVERAQNYFYTVFFLFYRQYIFMPKIWYKCQEYFGNEIKSFQEIEKHFSLLLASYDKVLDYPVSLPPAIISVGGLHTKRANELPHDLKKILDDSKDGVVLFSLGTNMLSKDLRKDRKQALIDGLGKTKQTILWKYEENITGLPKNFVIRKWLPQNDILAHPNVKAFLTHGGALSTQESMLHGVPVISMPFFVDQYVNTKKMVRRKLGKALQYNSLTSDKVYETVSEVLNNPVYLKNTKDISRRYKDQPEDPLTRAVWWVEYILRQSGAQHLRVASRDMSFIQNNMLDFWAVLIAILFFLSFILKRICCFLFGKKYSKTIFYKKKKFN